MQTLEVSEAIDINAIVFREDLYPRFEPSQATIQKYSESIEYLPPIKINQNNILIDGFHRMKAHQLVGADTIKCEVIHTASEKEVKRLAYETNSHHGLQLSIAEKKKFAQEMYGQMTPEKSAKILSVSLKTIKRWTENQEKAHKEEQERQIIDLYLKAWNTQQAVADLVGVPRQTITDRIKKIAENRQLSKIGQNFTPFIYNIWGTPKQDNDRKHFGAFPEVFMKNLLYYHTEPFDIVYDPFAGGGTTADICKAMYRRYYCSDRKVIPGRERDIRQHDINHGLPDDLQKPNLVFLDPPYWKQAAGQYSDDAADLGNMSLEEFNTSMQSLFKEITKRKIERIALVIQPTQYSNQFNWIDHTYDFNKMLDKYEIEMRYILPYSTQQYNAQMVEKAKEKKKALCINRDLIIWKLK